MSHIVLSYLIYLVVTILLTVFVARTLFKNGRLFLNDIFHGNIELSNAVNNLLLVGFYLVNIGYAVYTLKIFETVISTQQVIEILGLKIGTIILILGGMHFGNMFVFFKLRKKAHTRPTPPATQYEFHNARL